MIKKIKALRIVIALVLAAGMLAQGAAARNPDWRRTVGVYSGGGHPSSVVAAASNALAHAGYKIMAISPEAATTSAAITADQFFLYVIPDARTYPADGFAPLDRYLARQGNLVTIGGPAFTKPIYKLAAGAETTWYDKETYENRINQTKVEKIVFDFESPLAWLLEAGDPKLTAGEIGAVAGGVKGRCLAYKIAELVGWATYSTTLAPGTFSRESNLLSLWAKGDAQTKMVLLEMVETDGARWMYVLPVTSEWKHYAIFFDDFLYWHDSVTKDQRGQPGDHLNSTSITQLKFGLAGTHTPVSGGAHRFWIDEVGCAKSPLPNFKQARPQPIIETISPKYKGYPLTGITALKAAAGQTAIDSSGSFGVGENLWSPVRRSQGLGYTGQNHWRWVPLVNAYAGDSLRGSVASLLLNNDGKFAGSICASFGVDALDAAMAKALVNTAKRIESGLFLTEAGSEYFSYYAGERVKLGARVINGSDAGRTVSVRMQATAAGKMLWQDERPVTIKAHSAATVEFSWTLTGREAFTVRAELLGDGTSIDAMEHEVGILADKTSQPAPDEFVTVQGSDFYCQGRKWYPYGVNYWPSYIAGWDGDAFWGKWLAPGYYSPEGIEADLARMQQMGLNMASIQLHANPEGESNHMLAAAYIRNLLDFLRRCGEHRIKVNGFLPGASPLAMSDSDAFNEPLIAAYIRKANLASNPVLFAYDTIWEPGYRAFDDAGRKAMTADWNRWIVERYGQAENAIADWGFTPERSAESIAPPPARQMTTDGVWRIYVAAYRRFMDDFTSKCWQTAHRKIKQYDPNHLISYRQGNTTFVDFGLTGPVKHLDFVSPEAYGFPVNDDGINCAGFTTRYLQFTTGGKPVYWAEFGLSTWDKTVMEPDPQLIVKQGDYIKKLYQMAFESGARGIAPWWWPGGYRFDEGSDYGVINLDGTLRPAAEVMAKDAPRMTAARPYPGSDEWLTIDRDAHAGGYAEIILNAGRDAYQKARAAGKNLGIKSAGTGTDSANTPLLAVGNVPCNNHNPPKFLNAEFNCVSVKAAAGRWVEIFQNGQTVEVAAGQPVMVKVSIGNLGEAAWLAPKKHPGAGGVYLAARTGDVMFREPILADTAHLQDAATAEFTLVPVIGKRTEVTLEMTALDRLWFGEKFKLTLLPK